jgi:hypothetical protein
MIKQHLLHKLFSECALIWLAALNDTITVTSLPIWYHYKELMGSGFFNTLMTVLKSVVTWMEE